MINIQTKQEHEVWLSAYGSSFALNANHLNAAASEQQQFVAAARASLIADFAVAQFRNLK